MTLSGVKSINSGVGLQRLDYLSHHHGSGKSGLKGILYKKNKKNCIMHIMFTKKTTPVFNLFCHVHVQSDLPGN